MKTKLEDSVVVITGASSGIGRAAAIKFAAHNSTVILLSRKSSSLFEAAEECKKFGARVLPIPVDVTDEQALKEAAKEVVENFGKIDVWVNNAAVTLFSRVEEAPYEAYRQVIETNLFGYIHGARAVLPYFREQGKGVLINVSSMVGKIGSPYVSSYVASKFAVNGFSESLRMELQDAPGIHVCTLLPASIDTPIFQHAGNYSGRKVKPLDPVYSAKKVAQAIVSLSTRPRREIAVGNAGRVLMFVRAASPCFAENMQAKLVENTHFKEEPAGPSEGNLFHPMEDLNQISGGWRTSRESGAKSLMSFLPLAAVIGAGLWTLKRTIKHRQEKMEEETIEAKEHQARTA